MPDLLPYQQRIVDERHELDQKLQSLEHFISGDVFNALPTEDKFLLIFQKQTMQMYADILFRRIELFNRP